MKKAVFHSKYTFDLKDGSNLAQLRDNKSAPIHSKGAFDLKTGSNSAQSGDFKRYDCSKCKRE